MLKKLSAIFLLSISLQFKFKFFIAGGLKMKFAFYSERKFKAKKYHGT